MRVGEGYRAQPTEADHRMQAACREFEALFLAELLRPLDQALGKGTGGIMAAVGRQHLAVHLAGAFGLGNLLYAALMKGSDGSET